MLLGNLLAHRVVVIICSLPTGSFTACDQIGNNRNKMIWPLQKMVGLL